MRVIIERRDVRGTKVQIIKVMFHFLNTSENFRRPDIHTLYPPDLTVFRVSPTLKAPGNPLTRLDLADLALSRDLHVQVDW